MVVGAIASYLSDAVLVEVLSDNRLPSNLPTVDAELRMESEWVLNIKHSIWSVLAETCNASAVSLQSETI